MENIIRLTLLDLNDMHLACTIEGNDALKNWLLDTIEEASGGAVSR